MKTCLTTFLVIIACAISARAVSITFECACGNSDAVIHANLLSTKYVKTIGDKRGLYWAQLQVLKVIKSSTPISSELMVAFEGPSQNKDGKENGSIMVCPIDVSIALTKESSMTIALVRQNVGGMKNVWYIPYGDHVQQDSKPKKASNPALQPTTTRAYARMVAAELHR